MNIGKYNNKFNNSIIVGSVVFPDDIEDWCNQNCTGFWGWYWDLSNHDPRVYLSFEKEEDLVNYVLLRGVYNGKSICE